MNKINENELESVLFLKGTDKNQLSIDGFNIIKKSIENNFGGMFIDLKGISNQKEIFIEMVKSYNREDDLIIVNLDLYIKKPNACSILISELIRKDKIVYLYDKHDESDFVSNKIRIVIERLLHRKHLEIYPIFFNEYTYSGDEEKWNISNLDLKNKGVGLVFPINNEIHPNIEEIFMGEKYLDDDLEERLMYKPKSLLEKIIDKFKNKPITNKYLTSEDKFIKDEINRDDLIKGIEEFLDKTDTNKKYFHFKIYSYLEEYNGKYKIGISESSESIKNENEELLVFAIRYIDKLEEHVSLIFPTIEKMMKNFNKTKFDRFAHYKYMNKLYGSIIKEV